MRVFAFSLFVGELFCFDMALGCGSWLDVGQKSGVSVLYGFLSYLPSGRLVVS